MMIVVDAVGGATAVAVHSVGSNLEDCKLERVPDNLIQVRDEVWQAR